MKYLIQLVVSWNLLIRHVITAGAVMALCPTLMGSMLTQPCASVRLSVCIVGGSLLLCGLIVLSWIDQDDGQHRFGHTGGFMCPFVLLLPVARILINVYLLINLR